MKSLYIVAATLLLGIAAPIAMARPRVSELGYEASSSMVRLPASETGELTMQACDTCKVRRLRATPSTRYVIGKQPVTLAQLTNYLNRNPDSGMLVVQRNGTAELARVVVEVPMLAQ
jgi:hypothetical protein